MLCTITFSCDENIVDGYISDDLRYESNPFIVKQGEIKYTSPLAAYGSTSPITVELLDIRKEGEAETASSWMESVPTSLWTSGIDPATDITLDDVIKNRIKVENFPVIRVEKTGGRVMVSSESFNVQPGTYVIDIKATNSAGTKIIKDALTIILEEGVDYKLNYLESFFSDKDAPSGWIWRPVQSEVTVDPTAEGNRLVLKWMDKNGNFFNPKKGEVVNGWTENWRHHFDENTPWGVELTDDSMIFGFPFPPFPAPDYVYSYRIPEEFIGAYTLPSFEGKDFNTRMHIIKVYRTGTTIMIFKTDEIERKM